MLRRFQILGFRSSDHSSVWANLRQHVQTNDVVLKAHNLQTVVLPMDIYSGHEAKLMKIPRLDPAKTFWDLIKFRTNRALIVLVRVASTAGRRRSRFPFRRQNRGGGTPDVLFEFPFSALARLARQRQVQAGNERD